MLQRGHVSMSVRHDWLFRTGEAVWTGRRERDSLFEHCCVLFYLLQLSSLAFASLLSLPPLSQLFCFIPSVCTSGPGSRAVLTHAGSQQQSALLRDLRVFHHALPQPLLLPVRVHPVHLVTIALALRDKILPMKHLFCFIAATKEPKGLKNQTQSGTQAWDFAWMAHWFVFIFYLFPVYQFYV